MEEEGLFRFMVLEVYSLRLANSSSLSSDEGGGCGTVAEGRVTSQKAERPGPWSCMSVGSLIKPP